MASSRCRSRAPPRDHKGLIVEPQAAVLLQHALCGREVGATRNNFFEPLVFDLIHVDGGIPGGEQGRGADSIADFRRKRMHLVTKYRLIVRRYEQAEIARIPPQLAAQGRQKFMAVDSKRMLLRPQLLDDLQARIMSIRLNRQQPTRSEEHT